MENGEIFDEMFDLKPIIPELIFSNIGSTIKPQISDIVNGKTYTYPSSSSPNNFKNIPPPPALTSWISPPPPPASASASAPKLISFENHSEDSDQNSINLDTINFSSSTAKDDSSCSNDDDHGYNYHPLSISKKTSAPAAPARTPLQAQDHVVAERKRRENLGQLFISLSKAVPGLKKLDKASLLEDGINYVKALQERVRVLEEEEEEERIRRSSVNDAAREDSSSYNSSSSTTTATESEGPEIQARISEKQVLIKIFCRSEKGLMSRIPSEIAKMNLNVVDMRIMPFGGTALDITILAQMQREFEGTVKDIVDNLHTFFNYGLN